MYRYVLLLLLLLLAGCQAAGAGAARPARGNTDDLARLAGALPGDYDNHEQIVHAPAAAAGGAVPLHIRQSLRVIERDRDALAWIWQLQSADSATAATWLMRVVRGADGRIRITPYRALDPATAKTLVDGQKSPHIDAAQWADLAPCALGGAWQDSRFVASANIDACSAMLPGLGADAALLPLRLTLDGEMLHLQTFADRGRGPDALEDARRVRWFDGWAAINGGGPRATAQNQDWHLQRDLRLGSEGGRVALRWRDGSASGYSVELERTSYPERKLTVLQLNIIEDADGKALTYVWTAASSTAIGINLGWLQAGFVETASPVASSP